MRLIDADEALRRLPDDLPYKSSVRCVLMQLPTVYRLPVLELLELKIGDCKGCVWLNTRHQKCSCCRRNQCLKDNYKEAGV